MSRLLLAELFRLVVCLAVFFGGMGLSRAQSGAHGDGHQELHADHYQHWKDRRGYGCCDSSDCRPTRADKGDDGRWLVRIDGKWIPVPPDAVLPIPSPDGRSHVCMSPSATEPRCFVAGEPRI